LATGPRSRDPTWSPVAGRPRSATSGERGEGDEEAKDEEALAGGEGLASCGSEWRGRGDSGGEASLSTSLRRGEETPGLRTKNEDARGERDEPRTGPLPLLGREMGVACPGGCRKREKVEGSASSASAESRAEGAEEEWVGTQDSSGAPPGASSHGVANGRGLYRVRPDGGGGR